MHGASWYCNSVTKELIIVLILTNFSSIEKEKMMRQLLLGSSIILAYLSMNFVEGVQFQHVARGISGTCESDYLPGGRTTIKESTAPTATLQTTAMERFFTHSDMGKALGGAGTGTEILSKF